MAVDVSPTGSGSRENAFTASYRAEWAHFQAAIAGEAKVPSLAGARHPAQDHGRDLPVGGGRRDVDAVRRSGWGARLALLLAGALASAGASQPVAPRQPPPPRRAPEPHRLPHDHGPRASRSGSGSGTTRSGSTIRSQGTDNAYNYGLFDFRQENFLLRFLRGQMWYWMAGFPARAVRPALRPGQPLGLAPGARDAAARPGSSCSEFLEWNERPENRFYHYDYYRDNCSTRVRDALDRVLGGRIHAGDRSTSPPEKPIASTPSGSPRTIP